MNKMYLISRRVALVFIFIATAFVAKAQIKMPSFFTDSMVLQQQTNAAIWGTDKPNINIIVKTSWGKTSSTITDSNGKWKLKIATPAAGGPYSITVKGSNEVKLTNVLIGEVWLCSGQSNMEMPVMGNIGQPVNGSNEAILNSTNTNIRVFHTPRAFSKMPISDVNSKWKQASPATTGNFSATAYFFARKIQAILGVPVGIIQTSWGASNIESWMDSSTLATVKPVVVPEKTTIKEANTTHTMMYNSMLHPYVGYTIKGMLWYQGESNRERASEYQKLLSLFIGSLRIQWQQGAFPFYFVQIAPHSGLPNNHLNGAFLREAQLKTMQSVENTGMAVTLDIGEEFLIHPAEKQMVGTRLSYWALANNYNVQGIAYSGPVYDKIERIRGDSITVAFKYAERGLNTFGKPLSDFEIAGEDKVFYPAQAIFTKDKKECITVWSDSVKNPVSVRYAFKNWVRGCLYNTMGLPASSFRTDNW